MNQIVELGTVVAISERTLSIETINRSTCAQCSAKSVCGQNTLARWAKSANRLTIVKPDTPLQVGDTIEIAIAGDLLAKAALIVYLLPLILLILGSAVGVTIFDTELGSAMGAAFGLFVGVYAVAHFGKSWAKKTQLAPVFHRFIKTKSLSEALN